MRELSHLGAVMTKAENNAMLKFAKSIMNAEQFTRLLKSYRQLFWFQLAVPIGGVLLVPLGCLLFPEHASIIAAFGIVFILFLFIVILILSQFLVGRLWHKYVKLYNSNCHPRIIVYELFEEANRNF